ncbi:GntR family transcriptional regulator [Clostridiales bacterium COT073_COT-073]|nr:GntR family transcriptional regulator [Clostridiales bacterium COT073_COT-073]
MNKITNKGNIKKATSDIVYRSLRDDILHLALPPGSAISEIETANKYNVSRTPVRDAFKALENEGLLEVRPHIGTFISYIDLNKVSDIIFIRETTEQAVLKILSSTYTQPQLLKIRMALKEQENLINSYSAADDTAENRGKYATRFLKLDNDFHHLMFQLARKGAVWELLKCHSSDYERFRTLINWSENNMLSELYHQHIAIVDAIASKDHERLVQTISAHIYSGFNGNLDIILQNADYFLPESVGTLS